MGKPTNKKGRGIAPPHSVFKIPTQRHSSGMVPPAPTAKTPKGGNRVPPEKLAEVEELLRLCRSHSVIEQELSKKYGVHRRTVRYWITLVYEEWQKISQETKAYSKERLKSAFEKFFYRAMEEGVTTGGQFPVTNPDYKAALQALDRLARLEGVYEPDKLQIESGRAGFKKPENIRGRIAEILTRPDVAAKLQQMGVSLNVEKPPAPAQEGPSETDRGEADQHGDSEPGRYEDDPPSGGSDDGSDASSGD